MTPAASPEPFTARVPDDVLRDEAARASAGAGYLTLGQVAAYLGLSLGAVKGLRRRGTFPAALLLGPRSPRWRRSDLDIWANGQRERGGRMGPDARLHGGR